MVDILKAVSDNNRLRMLNLLFKYELCVCEIETILKMSQSNVSKHLKLLSDAGIVCSFKDAQWTFYKVTQEFKDSDKDLYNYLVNKFNDNSDYLGDIKIVEKYHSLSLDCSMIRKDKEYVLKVLEESNE